MYVYMLSVCQRPIGGKGLINPTFMKTSSGGSHWDLFLALHRGALAGLEASSPSESTIYYI